MVKKLVKMDEEKWYYFMTLKLQKGFKSLEEAIYSLVPKTKKQNEVKKNGKNKSK